MQSVVKGKILGWAESVINVSAHLEYADYNVGRFDEIDAKIADHVYATSVAISFRPSAQTVIRANYRYECRTDLWGNPASKTAGFQLGFLTYF